MSKHLQRDLERINRSLMTLFGVVEKMIDDSASALVDKKVQLVNTVIESDNKVNDLEVQIEEECLKILALHQPYAADLRHLTTVLKINANLERIADLTCNIAERAECLHNSPFFPLPDELKPMVDRATQMIRMALNSFVNSDSALAKQVILFDVAVDEFNLSIINELRGLMKQDSTLIEPALHCFSASRHIERIADHAEHIAEDVIYLVDGDIVRHKHGNFIA